MSNAGRYVEGRGPVGAVRCDGPDCNSVTEAHGTPYESIRLRGLSRGWAALTVDGVDVDLCSAHAPTLAQIQDVVPFFDPRARERMDRGVTRRERAKRSEMASAISRGSGS